MRRLSGGLWLAALGALSAQALPAAAAYPERPLRLVVPFPAGNPLDVRARQLAHHLPAVLGQQVIVDNRGGASGVIAMELVARAAPDGYTVLFANSTQLASNPALNAQLPYDVFRDYTPAALLARTPSLFTVSNTVPAQTLKELIALAKSRPGQLNFASQGNGTVQPVAGELLMRRTATQMVHVPYKVYSQILSDLFAGQVAFIIGGTPVLLPHVQGGRLRALAINTARRVLALPEVPTFDEAGVPNFWPAPLVATLKAVFNQTLRAADAVEGAAKKGQTLLGGSPAEFTVFMKIEMARYQALVKASGMTAD